MCDFSLHAVKSRPAKVGDKLTTRRFPQSSGRSTKTIRWLITTRWNFPMAGSFC